MTPRLLAGLLACCTLFICACPQQQPEDISSTGQPGQQAQDQPLQDSSQASDSASAAEAAADGAAIPQMQAPRQLVLIYTGNIHARLKPAGQADYDNLTGGLPALAAEIAAVEQEVVHYNRMRVANEGGDPSTVRVDLDAGLIGEHPFMLLDYGGWYAPDISKDARSSALLLEAMAQQRYTAVAFRDWPLFSAAELALLDDMQPLPTLVNSSAAAPSSPAGVERVVLRDVMGSLWGIVSLPRLPETDREKYDEAILRSLDECAAELELSGAQFSILLAADQTATLYRTLATDKRFSVVIGAPGTLAAGNGFDEFPTDGPLMLPHLNDGGTELARCHLIWDADSPGPMHSFFERRDVMDSGEDHLPWRKRVQQLTDTD